MGLKNPRLTIRHVGLNQLDLRHLSLGDPGKPDLLIPSLAMDFSWLDLLKGRIREIEITGLMLNVAVGKEGVTVKGLGEVSRYCRLTASISVPLLSRWTGGDGKCSSPLSCGPPPVIPGR